MKQLQQKTSHKCKDNLHFARLQALQGRNDEVIAKTIRESHPLFPIKRIGDWFSFGEAQTIISLGFNIFVTHKFIVKFNYAAMFNWDEKQQVVGLPTRDGRIADLYKGVYYSGDVPEYILDRVAAITQQKFRNPWAFVTLSKYKLPVKTSAISMPTRDPVMIALPAARNAHPLQIHVDENGRIVEHDGRKGVHSWAFYDKIAFIVGAWGHKQEYE